MRLLYLLLCGLTLPLLLQAQTTPAPEHYCGSHQGRSSWLKTYQAHSSIYEKGGDTTVYIPMTIHILGTDEGAGYYSVRNLLDAMCTLNELFEPTGLQFFIAGDILYHNNSTYYSHETVLEGAEMMFEYNVPNTLNNYFVSDPAGNCGYNLPFAGIANAKSCADPDDVTWAHEVGHALSLPHPFLGWEGGISYDGSVDHSFGNPAPEFVTYDYTYFRDTLIVDTLIIDTAYVELVDRSNCDIAADGFCDTEADYLAQRWTCNGDGVSPTMQTDPSGTTFRSQGQWIMNYANDPCQTDFSGEQTAAMRAFLFDQRAEWVSTDPPLETVDEQVTLVGPLGGAEAYDGSLLEWEAVPEATHYLVQYSRLSSFSGSITASVVTTDPFLVLDAEELTLDKTYYWRVRPYNAYATCVGFTDRESFFFTEGTTNTDDITELVAWQIFPQPVPSGQSIQLSWDMAAPWQGDLQLTNALGQVLHHQSVDLPLGQSSAQLTVPSLPAGVYLVRLSNGVQQAVKKIIVQ